MKLRTVLIGIFFCVASTIAQTDQSHSGGDVSTKLVSSSGLTQQKSATVVPQAGDTSKDSNTLQLVLLTLLVMGSIALRRSGSAR